MIAPDKIYVQPEWITGPERNYIYDTEPTPCAEEYIRKEAILEWAKDKEVDAKFATTDGIYYSGREHAFHELIDKLNSL